MVEGQIAARGIGDARILSAMRAVPRERFVPADQVEFAYEDAPLPIEEGQTISQPYIVAWMTAALELAPGDRVLEIGTGSGYAAAVLAHLAAEVYTIERHAQVGGSGATAAAGCGYTNVVVRCGDGTLGWPEHAPFDAIVVAAGGPSVPQALLAQLAIGGRLVIPIGAQTRDPEAGPGHARTADDYRHEELGDVRFVPLIGADGWAERGALARASRSLSLIARERRADRRHRDGAARPAARAHRRGQGRPPRRGDARHVRVLPHARAHHARADPASRLSHGRRRRRLAGCRPRRPLRAPSAAVAIDAGAPSTAFPPGCGATARSTSSCTGCANTTADARCPTSGSASTASTSTACTPRSRRCSRYLERIDPRRRRWRASATAA